MGQYHEVFNLDRMERIDANSINCGYKLMEQMGFKKSTSSAVFLLIANSNDRGGGDAKHHQLIGSWAGDRIVLQGDYAEKGDKAFIPYDQIENFKDISEEVLDMLNCVFD